MAKPQALTEQFYDAIANDEDARVCTEISDEACHEVPGNFFRILVSNTLTKVGDRLASPKTTLTWLLTALGAPALVIGLVVPIREAGSLLPQMLIASAIRRMPVRKWAWIAGSIGQAMALAGMALVALSLGGAQAGWSILALLTVFALARGLASIASKDVLGKTIPKTRRGRLTGLMGSASGAITLAAGGVLLLTGAVGAANGPGEVRLYAGLLLLAAVLWGVAAAVYSRVEEEPGATSGGGDAWTQARERLALLREDRPFRDFVVTRALAVGSGLAAPFVITLAHRELGGSALWLGLFILADGLAAMLSAPLWGRWADRSSRTVLQVAMAGTAVILVAVIAAAVLGLPTVGARLFFPLIFFLLGVAHSGVRLGRKTYLVDFAEGDQRTDYVAVSNSVIGVLLLLAGLLTGSLALLSIPLALALFAAAAIAGSLLALRLPDVSG